MGISHTATGLQHSDRCLLELDNLRLQSVIVCELCVGVLDITAGLHNSKQQKAVELYKSHKFSKVSSSVF